MVIEELSKNRDDEFSHLHTDLFRICIVGCISITEEWNHSTQNTIVRLFKTKNLQLIT